MHIQTLSSIKKQLRADIITLVNIPIFFISPKRQQTDNTIRQYEGGTMQKREA